MRHVCQGFHGIDASKGIADVTEGNQLGVLAEQVFIG